jgi:hypothetical protein
VFRSLADRLLANGQAVVSTSYGKYEPPTLYVDGALLLGFRTATLSFIKQLYPQEHPYFLAVHNINTTAYLSNVERVIAILNVIRSEVAAGWLITVKGVVTAELFGDFLSMAEHLLEEGYKDAAAVMIGSVLEGHLRQLCEKNSIAIIEEDRQKTMHGKAETLNGDLKKANIYPILDQKNVTAWLGLRNKAAHGEYAAYTKDQVKNDLDGITNFIARVPI